MVQHWGSMQVRFSARILIATQKRVTILIENKSFRLRSAGYGSAKICSVVIVTMRKTSVFVKHQRRVSGFLKKSSLLRVTIGIRKLFLNKSSKFSGIVNISKIGSMMSVTMFQTSLLMEYQRCSFCISCNEKASFWQGHKISRSSQIPVKCPVIIIRMLVELWTLRL